MALLWAYFANGFGQPKNPDYSLYLLSLGEDRYGNGGGWSRGQPQLIIGDFPYQYANALSTWEIECTSSSARSWH